MKKSEAGKGFVFGVLLTAMAVSMVVPALATSIEAAFNSINITVNQEKVAEIGQSLKLDNGTEAPFSIVYNGTTYLPLRKLGELTGKDVQWDGATSTVSIADCYTNSKFRTFTGVTGTPLKRYSATNGARIYIYEYQSKNPDVSNRYQYDRYLLNNGFSQNDKDANTVIYSHSSQEQYWVHVDWKLNEIQIIPTTISDGLVLTDPHITDTPKGGLSQKENERSDILDKIADKKSNISEIKRQLNSNSSQLASSEKELEKAKSQGSTRVYVQGQGFIYVADQDAIDSAQRNVDFYSNLVDECNELLLSAESTLSDYERKLESIDREISAIKANP